MTRRYLSPADKRAIIDIQGGMCGLGCGTRVGHGEEAEFDHILPLALGGSNSKGNMQAICKACHKAKTRKDIRRIRKADRQGKKHRGEKKSRFKIPSRPFSQWRKFNGEIVER